MHDALSTVRRSDGKHFQSGVHTLTSEHVVHAEFGCHAINDDQIGCIRNEHCLQFFSTFRVYHSRIVSTFQQNLFQPMAEDRTAISDDNGALHGCKGIYLESFQIMDRWLFSWNHSNAHAFVGQTCVRVMALRFLKHAVFVAVT